MLALARLRTQAARMRASSATVRAEDALDIADAALGLLDQLREASGALQHHAAGLERQLRTHDRETRALLDLAPVPLITTDVGGTIVDVNAAAAKALGRSAPRLRGELLLHFFDDRAAFSELVRGLTGAVTPQGGVMRVRPRERAPFEAKVVLAEDPRAGEPRWLWFLEKVSAGETPARMFVPPPSADERAHPVGR
jgi:PAS domain S-box-containing protein